jgi:SAM-dependent methyltransferase
VEQEVYRLLYELEDRHWWFRGREAVVDALLHGVATKPRPRILDAGCGAGRNVRRYSRLGPVDGFDPSEDAVAFCRERGLSQVRLAGIEDLPYESASFDLLMATDVLEHVADEAAALRELRRVAAPGAALIMTVPAYQWMWSSEDVRLGHRRRYTKRRLAAAVQAGGWRLAFVSYFNLALLPAIAVARLLRDLLPRKGHPELSLTPRALDPILAAPMRLEARLIKAGIPLPAGVSIAITCRR